MLHTETLKHEPNGCDKRSCQRILLLATKNGKELSAPGTDLQFSSGDTPGPFCSIKDIALFFGPLATGRGGVLC